MLLCELQSNNIVDEHVAIINSRLFFDFLFQDVPYAHKVQLWPYFNEEKKYLTMLITKIAMAHQVSLVIDTHILFVDFCRELTDIVREYEGKSSMIALYNPLESCYFREQTSAESHFEKSNKLVYEQLMFHKLFASNWKEFVSNFDNSILIDQDAGQIVFLSGKMGRFTPSLDKIKSFLKLNSIDPDELFNELEPLDLKQGVCNIREYMQKIVFDATKELIPKGTEISELDLEILKTIEDLKERL